MEAIPLFNRLKADMIEVNFVDLRNVYRRTDVQAGSFYVDIGRAHLSRTDAELEVAE